MENQGIIRKIDSLGRIVIPKEIRNALKFRNDTDIEILVKDDFVILKKKNDINIDCTLEKIIISFSKAFHVNILFTSYDKVLFFHLIDNNILLKDELEDDIVNAIANRENKIIITDRLLSNAKKFVIIPILVNGDIKGSIIIDDKMNDKRQFEVLVDILKMYLE